MSSGKISQNFQEYIPSTPSNWTIVPTTNNQALDLLVSSKAALPFLYYTVLPADIIAGQISLTLNFHDPMKVELMIVGGGIQDYNVDYTTIVPNVIKWQGFDLEGIIAAGDVLFINYPT